MMTSLSHYFGNKAAPELHPKARFWRSLLESGRAAKAVCEFRRPWQGLGFAPAKLYVSFFDEHGHEILSPDEVDWDPELDAELVTLGVPARTPENEAERTGMMLGRRFVQLQAEFGDGYFNAVLVEQLREKGFAAQPAVAAKLNAIHENAPSHDGHLYASCVEAIDGVLRSRAQALTVNLHYDPEKAAAILADAMAYFLDEEYSITSRKTLGFT